MMLSGNADGGTTPGQTYEPLYPQWGGTGYRVVPSFQYATEDVTSLVLSSVSATWPYPTSSPPTSPPICRYLLPDVASSPTTVYASVVWTMLVMR
jgi:hypothetical protein